MSNYYVYVYIDPRNFEDFYYGKGTGLRKNSHLRDKSDTEKVERIKAIRKEGLEPIIRVIATNLTEREALLIEASFLWKMGRFTDNIVGGHYLNNFRPLNSLHKEISNFDFYNGLYFYNVGEPSPTRNWDDYRKFNFISAGQEDRFRRAMQGFSPGDIFVAYLKGKGFVGVGKIKTKAKRINNILINGEKLLEQKLKCKNMDKNSKDIKKSEYVCLVEWIVTVSRGKAKWKNNFGLFTPRQVRVDLIKHNETIDFINKSFKLDIIKLIK